MAKCDEAGDVEAGPDECRGCVTGFHGEREPDISAATHVRQRAEDVGIIIRSHVTLALSMGTSPAELGAHLNQVLDLLFRLRPVRPTPRLVKAAHDLCADHPCRECTENAADEAEAKLGGER